jgi:hypothetical protein
MRHIAEKKKEEEETLEAQREGWSLEGNRAQSSYIPVMEEELHVREDGAS